MSRSFMSCSFVTLALAACSAPADPSGGDSGPVNPPGPTTTASLDPAECTAFAQSMVSAASSCGTALPSGAEASFEGWCKKGVSGAASCGGDPAAGLECFASPDPTDWVCSLGQPYPSCNGDLGAALGAMCLVALGNPSCSSGIQCEYDADCSGGMSCNSVTKECFSPQSYCIGLPCKYDFDCPSNEKCNSAEQACVGS